MSIWSIAFPFEAAVSFAGIAMGAARPLIGVSVFATLLLLFQPLLKGLLRAGILHGAEGARREHAQQDRPRL
jgi:hypothetical protein